MRMFERYAIFYCPSGALAQFGAAWLGWDNGAGHAVHHPPLDIPDIAAMTAKPRRYGLHATLKAPFHLRHGKSPDDLYQIAQDFAAHTPAVDLGRLALRYENGFIALRPLADQPALRALAAAVVRQFDPLRAQLEEAAIAQRRKARLSARQDAQMLEWGYPYIFDDYHFHLTLTGRIKPAQAQTVMDGLAPQVMPLLPDPHLMDAITIMGQDAQGMFHQVERFALIS